MFRGTPEPELRVPGHTLPCRVPSAKLVPPDCCHSPNIPLCSYYARGYGVFSISEPIANGTAAACLAGSGRPKNRQSRACPNFRVDENGTVPFSGPPYFTHDVQGLSVNPKQDSSIMDGRAMLNLWMKCRLEHVLAKRPATAIAVGRAAVSPRDHGRGAFCTRLDPSASQSQSRFPAAVPP